MEGSNYWKHEVGWVCRTSPISRPGDGLARYNVSGTRQKLMDADIWCKALDTDNREQWGLGRRPSPHPARALLFSVIINFVKTFPFKFSSLHCYKLVSGFSQALQFAPIPQSIESNSIYCSTTQCSRGRDRFTENREPGWACRTSAISRSADGPRAMHCGTAKKLMDAANRKHWLTEATFTPLQTQASQAKSLLLHRHRSKIYWVDAFKVQTFTRVYSAIAQSRD